MINWILKNGVGSDTVSITITKNYMRLSMCKDDMNNITKSGYLKVGIDENKMYFAEGDVASGYAIDEKTNRSAAQIHLFRNNAAWSGVHPLMYDESENLYYISVDNM